MRRQSKKTAARESEAKPILDALKAEVGWCEKCHARYNRLEAHEIADGSDRSKARGKRFATLILCWKCHRIIQHNKDWPEARQLRLLQLSRPGDLDLERYNALKGRSPNRITAADVAEWE